MADKRGSEGELDWPFVHGRRRARRVFVDFVEASARSVGTY